MKELDQLGFLEVMETYVNDPELDALKAWRKFRGEYNQHILNGRNADDRENSFKHLLERYRKYPAELVMDRRKTRTKMFKSDLAEAFMTTEGIQELDIEDWQRAALEPNQYDRAVIGSLDLLEEKKPEEATALRERAEQLWPSFFAKPEDADSE